MRARLRRHRLAVVVSSVFAGLLGNVWFQDGLKPFLVVLAAVAGCLLVVGSVGWVTGVQVVKHARRESAAIKAGRHPMKELVR